MTLEAALKMVSVKYENAKKLDHIRNPLAYALYAVWRLADKGGNVNGSKNSRKK